MAAMAQDIFSISFYSNRVYWLKRLLPVLAVALVLLLMVWPNWVENDSRFRIEAENVQESMSQSSMIVGPRYMGVTANGRPYIVAAAAAAPVPSQPMAVNLTKLSVELALADGKTLKLKADKATYWRDRNGMVLSGNILITSTSGYEIRTSQAYANFAENMIWNDKPILGSSPLGQFSAEGFKATSNGENIELLGKSRIFLVPRSPNSLPIQN